LEEAFFGMRRGSWNYENHFLKTIQECQNGGQGHILFHPKRNPSHDYVLLEKTGPPRSFVRRDYIKRTIPQP
jgi:hypothetical protein